jgi:hypothetical protein
MRPLHGEAAVLSRSFRPDHAKFGNWAGRDADFAFLIRQAARPASFRMADIRSGPLITGIPSPSGRQAGELEAASYGIMNDGR